MEVIRMSNNPHNIEHNFEQEMSDLRQEIEEFKKEKERVRGIVGKVGGMPTFDAKLFNIFFALFVGACLIVSIIYADSMQFVLGELAVAAVSIKLIYLLHNQQRVNHFQLWILSSLEWRVNEMVSKLEQLRKAL
jgi:hypothetical protein